VKDTVGPLLNTEGNKVSNHEEICSLLNEYFSSVFTDEKTVDALPEVKNMLLEGNNHMLSNVVITREEIIKRLRNLVVNKAPGVDGIVPRVLMECAYCLSEPIEYIYIYRVP
jgi:hypothetical protein